LPSIQRAMSAGVGHSKRTERTRSERVRARSEVKERLVVSGGGVGGEVRSATVCLLEDNTEEAEEAQGMEEFQEAAGDGVQLRQEVVIVNVSQNGDDLVEEVLSNSVVEVVADDSIEVVMETHNPVIDLTEAEDEVVVVDPGIDTRSEKVGKSVEIDLTSSPMPAPGPSPMQCPVCFDSLQSLLPPRTALSTKCGHLFCSSCLPAALQANGCCPTCRKRVRLTDAIRLFL